MWDVYTSNGWRIGLVKFWEDTFKSAYEEVTSDVPGVRDGAVLEIAKLSLHSIRLESPSFDSMVQLRAQVPRQCFQIICSRLDFGFCMDTCICRRFRLRTLWLICSMRWRFVMIAMGVFRVVLFPLFRKIEWSLIDFLHHILIFASHLKLGRRDLITVYKSDANSVLPKFAEDLATSGLTLKKWSLCQVPTHLVKHSASHSGITSTATEQLSTGALQALANADVQALLKMEMEI